MCYLEMGKSPGQTAAKDMIISQTITSNKWLDKIGYSTVQPPPPPLKAPSIDCSSQNVTDGREVHIYS